MAELDSLEIKLKSNAKDVAKDFDTLSNSIGNTSHKLSGINADNFDKVAKSLKNLSKIGNDTKSLDDNLKRISESLNAFANNINRIDTSKIDSLADKMDKFASISKKKLSETTKAVQEMDASFANSDGIKKSQQTVEEFMESIKGIGKNQQFFGASSQLDKEIESTQNKIEKIKTSLEAYNQEGKSVETKGWRTAQRQLEQYSNYLDNLLEKQKSMQGNPLGFQFDENAIANSNENIYKLLLSDEEYAKMREKILAKGIKQIEIPVSLDMSRVEDINNKVSNIGAIKFADVDLTGLEKVESKMSEIENKTQMAANKIRSDLMFEPTILQDDQRYSDVYINLEKQIKQAEQQLEKFLNTQERLDETGVNKESQRYKNVEIQIRDADNQLQRLNQDMKNLQSSGGDVVNISQFERLSGTLSGVQGVSQNLARALRAVGAGSAASGVQSISANIGALSSGLAGATTAAEGTSAALVGMQTAIPVIGLILAAVTLLVKAFTSLAKAAINALKKIGNAIKTVIGHVKNLVSNILSIGTSSYQAQTAVGKFINKIIGLFKSRVLRQAITQAIQYMKDGFSDLDKYSERMGTPLHNNITSFKESLVLLGRSIAAAFEPILNVVLPILTTLINALATAINYVNQFFSALFGGSFGGSSNTYTKATSGAEAYTNATSGATKAQKELNKAIREWDKLNVITDPNKNDGGGSGSGGSSGGAEPFETEPINNRISDLAKALKEAWENGADFTWFGAMIGGKLKEALDSLLVDGGFWDELKTFASKFGKALATLINGFVEFPGLADTLGETIAEAINTALNFFESFTGNIHGDSIGTFIGELIKSALEHIEWDKWITGMGNLGRELAKAINALADTDVLSEIAKSFAKLLKGAIEGAYQFVTNLDFKNLGKKIGTAISDFFKEMNEVDESGMTGWQKLGTTVSDFVIGVEDMISNALNEIDWDAIGKSVKDFLLGIDWVTIISKSLELQNKVSGALFELFKIAAQSIAGISVALSFTFLDNLKEEMGKAAAWLLTAPLTIAIKIADFVQAIKDKWDEIKGWLFSNPTETKFNIPDIVGIIKGKFAEAKTWLETNVLPIVLSANDKVSGAIEKIKKLWDGLGLKQKALKAKVTGGAEGAIKKIKSAWSSLKASTKTFRTNIGGTALSGLQKVKNIWDSLTTKTKSLSLAFQDTVSSKIKSMWNGIANGINSAISIINKIPGVNIATIPKLYATGGFPEDGWFRASHGEYFGQFDNGQSVIANNKQIENGLMNTVRAGNSEVAMLMAQELEETRQQNELLRQILAKDSGISYKDVFKATQKGASEYQKMTGTPAFI